MGRSVSPVQNEPGSISTMGFPSSPTTSNLMCAYPLAYPTCAHMIPSKVAARFDIP